VKKMNEDIQICLTLCKFHYPCDQSINDLLYREQASLRPEDEFSPATSCSYGYSYEFLYNKFVLEFVLEPCAVM